MKEFLLNILPTVAGTVLAFAYCPQILQTYKTKDVTNISLLFWVLISTALVMLLINAIVVFYYTGVWGYMLVEIFNAGLALVMLYLVLKYRRK